MWETGTFELNAWADGAWWSEDVPDIAPVLLGHRPRQEPTRNKENDEALLIALGIM
jgi:hypothetical protein